MRLIITGLLALILAGCQTTQTTRDSVPQDEAEVISSTDNTTQTLDHPTAQSSAIDPVATASAPLVQTTKKATIVKKTMDPEAYTDLWDRISDQFSLNIPLNRSKVKKQIEWYKKHPNYMIRISERARPYLYWIVTELEKRQLPLELALLPIVESSYDPFAYSSGHAAGMWQIIPGTGRHLGLAQNWWYDGRRDVLASTDAALNYLTSLNKEFGGDWLKTLAAYNSGGGRVRSAIRTNQKLNKPTDFWSLELPNETKAYVPKLLAVSALLKHRDQHQLKFSELANRPYFQPVDIDSQIDLAVAADLAGIELSSLQQLNPAFNQWSTAPQGPHLLLLPIDKITTFKQALAQLPEAQRMQWQRYKVVSGDSLIRIAKLYQTTPKLIREVNKLNSNLIRIGQHLLIPTSPTADSSDITQLQRMAKIQSKSKSRQKIEYSVKSGDNLWNISRNYEVSYKQLAKWNSLPSKSTLKIGQKLVIWLQEDSASGTRSMTYKVRSGDSLYVIAKKFKVKVDDLVKWNQLHGKRYLQPGQKLKLFVDA